jgi:hypothetical protein
VRPPERRDERKRQPDDFGGSDNQMVTPAQMGSLVGEHGGKLAVAQCCYRPGGQHHLAGRPGHAVGRGRRVINDDNTQSLIPPAGKTEKEPMPPTMAPVDA